MYACFPKLPVIESIGQEPSENVAELTQRVVVATLPRVERVQLGYAALCHLLHLSRNAATRWCVYGRLCGVQLDNTVNITDVRANVQREQRRDLKETEEERYKRQEAERREMQRVHKEADATYHNEEFDTYQVGQFAVVSTTFNPYTESLPHQLMELHNKSQPAVLLTYDPFSTALLGKPHLRAYVLTDEYVKYYTLVKASKDVKFARVVRESNVTGSGVLREVPVEIDVDAYHKLGLAAVQLHPITDSFVAIQSDAVNNYAEALVESIRSNTATLTSLLVKESKANMNDNNASNSPLAQRIQTLLLLQHLREQTQHLEALCNSTLLNTAMLRDV